MNNRDQEAFSGFSEKSESEREQKEIRLTFEYSSERHYAHWRVWKFWLVLIGTLIVLAGLVASII